MLNLIAPPRPREPVLDVTSPRDRLRQLRSISELAKSSLQSSRRTSSCIRDSADRLTKSRTKAGYQHNSVPHLHPPTGMVAGPFSTSCFAHLARAALARKRADCDWLAIMQPDPPSRCLERTSMSALLSCEGKVIEANQLGQRPLAERLTSAAPTGQLGRLA